MSNFPTQGPHVEAFFRTYLRHTKGKWAGSPVLFEDWQRFVTDETFRLDGSGTRVYTDVTLGIPRKNSKSTLCAGYALYLLGPDGEPGPEVYASAGSGDQANIVFGQAKGFVEANAAMRSWFRPMERTIRCDANGGFMRRLAADGKLNHGLNPHGSIIDELHAFQTPRQIDNYEALTTAGAARSQPLVISISTAGDDPDSILGRIYREMVDSPAVEKPGGAERERLKAGLTMLRDPETGRLVVWYGADEDADIENPDVWRAANPASWVSIDYLKRQFTNPNVPESSFRKLHLNQFTKARDGWLPWGTWPGLVVPVGMANRVAVGVDIGLTQDTSAVAWAAPAEDGSGRMIVRAHVWSARDDVAHHTFVPGGRVRLELIEDFIRNLARTNNVGRVHYDPRFFERSAQLLSDDGFVVAPLNQNSAPMADAYQEFYTDARTAQIGHDGDPILASHVESTAAVRTERGWRVSKLKSNRRIDACVAACMALYGARRIDQDAIPKPWVGRA